MFRTCLSFVLCLSILCSIAFAGRGDKEEKERWTQIVVRLEDNVRRLEYQLNQVVGELNKNQMMDNGRLDEQIARLKIALLAGGVVMLGGIVFLVVKLNRANVRIEKLEEDNKLKPKFVEKQIMVENLDNVTKSYYRNFMSNVIPRVVAVGIGQQIAARV
jgi:hypothetical protein